MSKEHEKQKHDRREEAVEKEQTPETEIVEEEIPAEEVTEKKTGNAGRRRRRRRAELGKTSFRQRIQTRRKGNKIRAGIGRKIADKAQKPSNILNRLQKGGENK